MSQVKSTYQEFINQFPVVSNPSFIEVRKSHQPGMCYHHIIPVSYQAKLYNIVKSTEVTRFKWDDRCDKRCVILSRQDHAFAHWLWDREHPDHDTVRFLRNSISKTYGIRLEKKAFLTLDAEYVYDLFEVLNYTDFNDKIGHLTKTRWQDPDKRDYIRKRMSEAKIGKVNVCRDRVWVNKVIDGQKVFKRVPKDQLDEYVSEDWKLGYKATRGRKS